MTNQGEDPVMQRFVDRTVIVTGGARGMGASHVRGFVEEGANVLLTDVRVEEGQALADELGEQALFKPHDVRSQEDWSAVVETAEGSFGPVDVLVNNAGVAPAFSPISESDPADFRRVLDINLFGTYLGMRAVNPSMSMAGGGAIVNISSFVGLVGAALVGNYVASKWGIRGITKTAAVEMARDKIRVNSIHPGVIQTPMLDEQPDLVPPTEGYPIPRPADPAEVTRMVLFVASDEASFSTGSEFVVDGGYMLGMALPAE